MNQFKFRLNYLIIPFSVLIIVLFQFCNSSTNGPEIVPNELSTLKKIIQSTVHATARGFGGVFDSVFTSEQSRFQFSRKYIKNNKYLSDTAGYLYLDDFNYINIAHGTDTTLQGQDRSNVKDANNKYYIRDLINNAKTNLYDFVEYYYNNASTGKNERRYAYAERIKGADYAICSEFHLFIDTKVLSELDKNKLIVCGIVNTVSYGSGKVFKEILITQEEQTIFFRKFVDSIRFFDDLSGYLFVVDLNGLCIANAANKPFEGTNVSGLQDSKGKYFIQEMIALAQSSGSGYVEYYWKNPATQSDEKKLVYIERIKDTNYFIAAGVYI